MDNPILIDAAETHLWECIEEAHKAGLNYWQILRIVIIACQDLMIKSEAEYWLNQK